MCKASCCFEETIVVNCYSSRYICPRSMILELLTSPSAGILGPRGFFDAEERQEVGYLAVLPLLRLSKNPLVGL
jgi:hypothetical protein